MENGFKTFLNDNNVAYENIKVMATPRRLAVIVSELIDESVGALKTKYKNVVEKIRRERPEIIVDGEMQLDAAINERIGKKKASGSKVAGRANVLIAPDLNSGNILYKAIEHFGGYAAAGPILQGFRAPISDLSRGSNVSDVILTIETLRKIIGE